MRAAPGVSGRSQTLFAITRCLPFLVLAAVLGIELSPAHTLYTGPLLSPAPALAAVTMGPVGTGGVTVLAGVVSAITAIHNDAWGTPQLYANLLALLVVAVASMATCAVRVRRDGELAHIRRIAEVMHRCAAALAREYASGDARGRGALPGPGAPAAAARPRGVPRPSRDRRRDFPVPAR
ncbi:hypothetical protein V2J94_01580 [Streptomyces sp. DSM 41524]|uniref:Uncharacterized protein n=1 Tax=Streptomyces asiaticus subsp. ignotus TaxID=3098222 RepID=A0ABU7PQT0_9ACTN|nr:hypothetical protein [Streptomyces sp. DSM 41524]